MKDNKLNILFLASWYPNKVTPKNGNFIQKHAEAVSTYCNVYALHIIARKQDENFVIETVINNNISETIVYYKKVVSKMPIIHHILKLSIRRKAHDLGFQKIIKTAVKIDLIHLNVCFPAGIYALHLKKKYKILFIISEHWTIFLSSSPNHLSFIQQFFVNKINRAADRLCPVSDDLKMALKKIAPNQSYSVVPNVVNTNIFKLKNTPIKRDKIKILHLSNLNDEHKNITGILNVIKQLSKKRNDFKLTIAGDGNIEKFKRKAIALSIPKELIEFESEKTTNEVAELMSENDVFLLFSNYENLPCVIAEALIVGLPVIATNVGGISEMLNKNNGIIVEPKDEVGLLKQLNFLINNISNYNNAKIAENATKIYSYGTVGKQFFNIYQSIL